MPADKSMSKQGFFSTSFNGYNKKEVTDYIEEQAAEAQKLRETIEKLKKEIKDQSDLVAENERLRARVAELEEDKAKKEESSEKNDDDEDKRRQYYELCVQMGEKLLSAEASSQMIINNANEKAEEIIAGAKAEGKKLVAETAENLRKQSECVYEAIRLHRQKQQEIGDALTMSLRVINELIKSIEEQAKANDLN